jgi:gluconokinase
MSQAIIVMGVSGSGKTTVGRALARQLGVDFFEGDDFHPPSNVAKMQSGEPLTDADRQPWLERLHQLIADEAAAGRSLVLACSALKESYRRQLSAGGQNLRYVFLKGDFDLIVGRMRTRLGHYMPESLLQTQFDALEEPEGAIVADINLPVSHIVADIAAQLSAE